MGAGVLAVMTGVVGGDEGVRKIRQLCANAAFFRRRLKEMGCHVLGDDDSPIVPMMLYSAPTMGSVSRECLRRGLAVVVVGFPAVGASNLILTSTLKFKSCYSIAYVCDVAGTIASRTGEILLVGGAHARNAGARIGAD